MRKRGDISPGDETTNPRRELHLHRRTDGSLTDTTVLNQPADRHTGARARAQNGAHVHTFTGATDRHSHPSPPARVLPPSVGGANRLRRPSQTPRSDLHFLSWRGVSFHSIRGNASIRRYFNPCDREISDRLANGGERERREAWRGS